LPEKAVGLHDALQKLCPSLNDLEVSDTSLLYASLPLLIRFYPLISASLRYVVEELNFPIEELEDAWELICYFCLTELVVIIKRPINVPPLCYLYRFFMIC
jgi:hypothetical protein